MALRKIVYFGDPILRKKSRDVTRFDERTAELVSDLKETLVAADGQGLAAPQVGILRKVFVMRHGEDVIELINPEIIKQEGAVDGTEGCLSLPGWNGYVSRPEKLTVKAYDAKGSEFELEVEGIDARCVCHENDHLYGILYIDRAQNVFDNETGDPIPESRWKNKL